MTLPAIFGETPLGLETPPLGAVHTNVLNMVIQSQQQTNWCWAACTVSVSSFFLPSTAWTQCSLVNNQLNQATCCQNGGSAACNQPYYLDRALRATGNLNAAAASPQTYDQVQADIDAGTPLGVRIGWTAGGGHVVLIYGYTNPEVLYVADPFYGYTLIDVADFPSNYSGGGTWTHSYTTKSA